MGTTRVSWSGTVTFKYNDKEYSAEVTAHADHWYRPGRMHMANGDPGYPTEDEIDDIEFDVDKLIEVETGETVVYTEDMANEVDSAINDQAEWEEDVYENEPPDDYYEEREIARWEAECSRCGY